MACFLSSLNPTAMYTGLVAKSLQAYERMAGPALAQYVTAFHFLIENYIITIMCVYSTILITTAGARVLNIACSEAVIMLA